GRGSPVPPPDDIHNLRPHKGSRDLLFQRCPDGGSCAPGMSRTRRIPPSAFETPAGRRLLRLAREDSGIDFELYSPAMLARRVAHRMENVGTATLDEYLEAA